jgi:hypothetical protein
MGTQVINQITEALVKGILSSNGSSVNSLGQTIESNIGYMVSTKPNLEYIVNTAEPLYFEVLAYVERVVGLLGANSAIGAWVDAKSGKVYLDVSECILDLNTAIKLAKQANQKAIFDLNRKETIYV